MGMGKRIRFNHFQLRGLSVLYTGRSGGRMNRYLIFQEYYMYVVNMTQENTLSDDFRDGLSPADLKKVAKTFNKLKDYLESQEMFHDYAQKALGESTGRVEFNIYADVVDTGSAFREALPSSINSVHTHSPTKHSTNCRVHITVLKDDLEEFIHEVNDLEP